MSDCKVDFGKKTVTVKVAKGTDPQALVKALDGTRFTATVK